MNSSCFIICELNWIVFMAIVKHFLVIQGKGSSGSSGKGLKLKYMVI